MSPFAMGRKQNSLRDGTSIRMVGNPQVVKKWASRKPADDLRDRPSAQRIAFFPQRISLSCSTRSGKHVTAALR